MSVALARVRVELDAIDDMLVAQLAARFARLERVAEVKAREGLPGHDPERERAILERVERKLVARGVDEEIRAEVLRVVRATLALGRSFVKRRARAIASARHDPVDGNPPVDPGARRDPGGVDQAG